MWFQLGLFLLISHATYANAGECKQADEQEMADCLKPLINTWQGVERRSPETAEIMFSLFLYKRADLEQLCVDFRWLKQTCFSERMHNCKENPYMTFFESLLSFACGTNTKAFFDRLDCIKTAMVGSNQCSNWIRGAYLPGKEDQKCANMQPYFSCIINNVQNNCNSTGAAVFKGSIEAFGCPLQPAPFQLSAEQQGLPRSNNNAGLPRSKFQGNLAVLGNPDRQAVIAGVSESFSPKAAPVAVSIRGVGGDCIKTDALEVNECLRNTLQFYTLMRAKRLSPSETTFSTFTYSKAEMERLCTDYKWLQSTCFSARVKFNCREHPDVKFFESILGFPCGSRFSPVFFDRFDCIHNVSVASSVCSARIEGLYTPEQQLNKCKNIPEYYQCMEANIESSCGQNGLNVFRATVESLGCQLPPPTFTIVTTAPQPQQPQFAFAPRLQAAPQPQVAPQQQQFRPQPQFAPQQQVPQQPQQSAPQQISPQQSAPQQVSQQQSAPQQVPPQQQQFAAQPQVPPQPQSAPQPQVQFAPPPPPQQNPPQLQNVQDQLRAQQRQA